MKTPATHHRSTHRLAMLLFATVGLGLLGGCLTPEQQAAQRAQYLDDVRQRCMSYGYPPGGPLAACVQQTVQADEYRRQWEMDRMQAENQAMMDQMRWRAELAQRETWARQEAARREAQRHERDQDRNQERRDQPPPQPPQ